MLSIYSSVLTARLQFVCDFIFKEQFGLNYAFRNFSQKVADGEEKICYNSNRDNSSSFFIQSHGLLFEENITEQQISCFTLHGFKAFFKIENSDIEFDIFSAIFYLIIRYEEYLPHTKDMYGRYAHENSLAFKEKFLDLPLVNYWLHHFKNLLLAKFPALVFKEEKFSFLPTYDIDIAYSYKGKGLLRNIGGFLQSPGRERIAVNLGKKKDPYDAYEFLDHIHQKFRLQPIYFFLLADKISQYDKNLPPDKKRMQDLLQVHAQKYETGIHPSWESYNSTTVLQKEIETLKIVSQKKVINSRQHYIRFSLPETFRLLNELGITDEYSMGYGSINGFRASVASSFYWYDLPNEKRTNLRLHPFCFMDANSFFEEKLTAADAFVQLEHYYHECKKVEGIFISIFHNNFLGTERMFEGYREMYERFLEEHFFVV